MVKFWFIRNDLNEKQLKRSLHFLTKIFILNFNFILFKIQAYLDFIVQQYPLFASTYVTGKSIEGRNLRILKINVGTNPTKKAWFDCGIHAREWITPVTCLNLIDNVC